MNDQNGYELLDSGNGRKLERFGSVVLARPASQAVWRPSLPPEVWQRAHASFDREDGNRWFGRNELPEHWILDESGIRFHLASTDFGHLGIFPEQRAQWRWMRETIRKAKSLRPADAPMRVLNLFAYSGGSSLASAQGGALVTHLDASRGMVDWAAENAALNHLSTIRWIVDDATKFLHRELRRGKRYEGIILDPPTFGRGERGEMFKIERDLPEIMQLCRRLLSDDPLFLLLSAHTPGCSPQVLANVAAQSLAGLDGSFESGEMLLTGAPNVFPLPSGTYVRWYR